RLLHHVPDVVDSVAGLVPRLSVLDPQIERLAPVCPLSGAIVARDDRKISARFAVRRRLERGPVHGALVIAHTLAPSGGILVEGVESHIRVVDHDATRISDRTAI